MKRPSSQAMRNPRPDGFPPQSLREHIAKAIYEVKYPDASWENLHPNRLVRKHRLAEADAVVNLLTRASMRGMLNS